MMEITPEEDGLSGCSTAEQQRGFREDGRPGPRHAAPSSVLGAGSWDTDLTARFSARKAGACEQASHKSRVSLPTRLPHCDGLGAKEITECVRAPPGAFQEQTVKVLQSQDIEVTVGLILGLDFHNLLQAERKKKKQNSLTEISLPYFVAGLLAICSEPAELTWRARVRVQGKASSPAICGIPRNPQPGWEWALPTQAPRCQARHDLNVEDISACNDFASWPSSLSSPHPISESIIPLRNVLFNANIHTSLIPLSQTKKKKQKPPLDL